MTASFISGRLSEQILSVFCFLHHHPCYLLPYHASSGTAPFFLPFPIFNLDSRLAFCFLSTRARCWRPFATLTAPEERGPDSNLCFLRTPAADPFPTHLLCARSQQVRFWSFLRESGMVVSVLGRRAAKLYSLLYYTKDKPSATSGEKKTIHNHHSFSFVLGRLPARPMLPKPRVERK